jgi:hypothetical protein
VTNTTLIGIDSILPILGPNFEGFSAKSLRALLKIKKVEKMDSMLIVGVYRLLPYLTKVGDVHNEFDNAVP